MWAFACWAVEYLGFVLVSVWCLLDHAARLVAVGVLARLAWRAKDDDSGSMDAVGGRTETKPEEVR